MENDRSFQEWMNLLQTQDEDAARHVFQEYGNRLIGLARTKLDPSVRRRVDPEDVVQSVFRSFFQRYEKGNWNLEDWGSVWSMLTVITARKCGRQNEFNHSQKRDVSREVSSSKSSDDSTTPQWEAQTPEPSPESAVMLAELVTKLISAFKDKDRPIVELCLQGMSVEAIAEESDCSESKVYRIQRYIQNYLMKLRDA